MAQTMLAATQITAGEAWRAGLSTLTLPSTVQVTALRRASVRTGIRLRTRAAQDRSGGGGPDDRRMPGDAQEQESLVRTALTNPAAVQLVSQLQPGRST